MQHSAPPLAAFTPAERRLVARLRTPRQVQDYLNRLPYNTEPPPGPGTLRGFRQVVRRNTAHCLEAALFAACVLEQHGFPPLLMSLKSLDLLDHVIFVYRQGGRWGSVARSRDPGLHGRRPLFRSARALALSYFDAYIDFTGALTGYGVYDLTRMGSYDWRFSPRNMWAVERALIRLRHQPIKGSRERIRGFRKRYRAYWAKHQRKPLFYRGKDKWTPIPREFL